MRKQNPKQGFWNYNDSKALPGPWKHTAVTVEATQGFWIPGCSPQAQEAPCRVGGSKTHILDIPETKRLKIAMIDAL